MTMLDKRALKMNRSIVLVPFVNFPNFLVQLYVTGINYRIFFILYSNMNNVRWKLCSKIIHIGLGSPKRLFIRESLQFEGDLAAFKFYFGMFEERLVS